MSRPILSEHDKRLALLEERTATTKEHDAAHDAAVLAGLKEIRDDVKSLRKYVEDEVKALSDHQTKTETRVDKVLGNVRAFGAGMAAAFTLLGGGIATVVGQVMGWFK